MKIIRLDEHEIGAVIGTINVRLNGIRGYHLTEQDYLESALEKLTKNNKTRLEL